MANAHRLYVGTIGEGLWRSLDGGETFSRTCDGMFVECHIRAIAVHPDNPRILYLGTEQGLFRSENGADHWSQVDSPLNGLQIWSILLLPGKPEVLLVGTCPSRLFRCADGRWQEARVTIRQDCPRIISTRVTSFCAHPRDPQTVWAGVEIDGIYCSRDAGISWQPIGKGLSSQDIHALAASPTGGEMRLIATTNNDVNVSQDEGETWQPLHLSQSLPLPYFRGLIQQAGNPHVLLLGNGDAPPGTTGLVARSRDGGVSWQPTQMPGRANSTMWTFAVHPADPNLIYASSVSGQLYRSSDAGASWQKISREFGEIRALAWTP